MELHALQADHDKQERRAEDIRAARVSADQGEATVAGDAALLYQKKDLSLREGETIKYDACQTL